MMPAGGEMEKASIDEVFIDYTIPVRALMLERYPQLHVPDGLFDLDTPLPAPPEEIDWAGLNTHVIPVTSDSPPDKDANTPSLTLQVPLNETDSTPAGLLMPVSPDLLSADVTKVGSDVPPTWHDVALSIAAELMRDIRQATFEKLGYTLSAGIARNKMLAKLSASYRKPMAQSVLRNVAIPGYLGPMPFQKIRFLGGKLGDAMATQFGATTVSELREIELEDMQRRCGEESIWVWNVLRTIVKVVSPDFPRYNCELTLYHYTTVKERTALKSMMASKNVRPAITKTEQARHWLAVLSAELAVRLTDARKVNPTVWPRTLVLHIRQGSNAPRSKQVTFPFAREFSATTILAPAEKLWRMLLPGTGDLTVGVINVALGFAGLDALEAGQKGIEGFFSTKGPRTSAKKAPSSINGATTTKSGSLVSESKARRASSPASTDNKHQGKEQSSSLKRDFFNRAASNKRKIIVHEVLDDSSSDIVEISPPPAKRMNSGSSGQAEPKSSTPTPVSSDAKQRNQGPNDKDKAKNGKAIKATSKGGADIANFFAPRSGAVSTKAKGKK
ncbi:DNA polymerase eta subunit [Rhizoctonia solani]|uniref:DNA polymerase eta n=1 Tax=Rhizoctonia solani TaxID=456999 RepID=A0A0K6GC14_9AGAM|nr:DNA polymerase eta subunit [Rhizoctonia solani]